MKRPQRSLLPATSSNQSPQELSMGRQDPIAGLVRVARRSRYVLVACNYCRSKRKACNGQRPSCARCIEGDLACVYESSSQNETRSMAMKSQLESLKQDLQEHIDFFEQLSSMPENEALAVLRQMKATPKADRSIATLMGNVSTVNRPSDLKHAHKTLPSTKSTLESELAICHGMVYPALEPIDATSIDVDALLRDAPYRLHHSLNIPSLPSDTAGVNFQRLSLPPRKPHYCDGRLETLNLEYWTRAPISNEAAARAISLYLQTDHPLLALFDADLFLDDLVNHQLNYCSPFLVSALLYLVCQSYASLEVAVRPVIQILFQEAKMLWTSDRSVLNISTVSATLVFGVACTMSGKESLAFRLLAEVRRKATQISLFGVPHNSVASQALLNLSKPELRAWSHVAWGAYNWLSLHTMFFYGDTIPFPPALPIPGEGKSSDASQSSFYEQSHPLPLYMGQTFPYSSKLWTIVQEIQAVYLKNGTATSPETLPLSFAESKYRKLLSWASSLPPELQQNDQSPAHVLILHGLFHGVVLDAFRPFMQFHSSGQRLHSFYSQDSTPAAISEASFNQIKRIVYIYMSKFQPQLHCLVFVSVVLQLNNILLRTDGDPEKRLYVLLGMHFLIKITARYPIFARIARAHLTMALRGGLLNSAEASWLMNEVNQSGQDSLIAIRDATTSWIVDFDLAMITLADGQADTISRQFEEALVFEEFTTGNLDEISIAEELEKGKEDVIDKSNYSGISPSFSKVEHHSRLEDDSEL